MEDAQKTAFGVLCNIAQLPADTRLVDRWAVDECAAHVAREPLPTPEETARFVRDLRDNMVYGGACTDSIIAILSVVEALFPPETDDARALRRAELEAARASAKGGA